LRAYTYLSGTIIYGCRLRIAFRLCVSLLNLPEKLIVTRLVMKFSTFYGTLISTRCIQPTASHPTFVRYNLISFRLHQGLASGLFPSGFPTKTLYTFLVSPCVLHDPPISCSLMLSSAGSVTHSCRLTPYIPSEFNLTRAGRPRIDCRQVQ